MNNKQAARIICIILAVLFILSIIAIPVFTFCSR